MRIRMATDLDRDIVRAIHLCAFPEEEGELVAMLAVNLLREHSNPETINLLAESDSTAVGHIAFSPVTLADNTRRQGYILAPLAVKPEYQKRGVGAQLIRSGMHLLSKQGVHLVFVYGDPAYYGKFGFKLDVAAGFSPNYELRHPFGWQAIALNDGGSVNPPAKISCVAPLSDLRLW